MWKLSECVLMMIDSSLGLLFLLCGVIVQTKGQYNMPVKNTRKSPCDDSNKTSLVEHFFNVVFTEFHSNQPVCVCVQMCVDEPTYCYPNGCLKKVDGKKKTSPSPVAHIQNEDSSKTMFLVDERNNFAQILNARVDESYHAPKTTTPSDFFSDPLKDMYKTLFKYKKMPKVELHYNRHEQVKNTKSDILKYETEDVSKTRWPQINYKTHHDQKLYANDKINQKIILDSGKGKFFLSSPERTQNSYTSRYFKRDLRRNRNADLDALIQKSETKEKDFSVENLIENLIGNTFVAMNSSKQGREHVNDLDGSLSNQTLNTNQININDTNAYRNEILCTASINATDEGRNENRNADESMVEEVFRKWRNYTFDQMITALSKRIEEHNRTSLGMLKQVSEVDRSVTTNKAFITSPGLVNVEIVERKTHKLNNDSIASANNNNSSHFISNESSSQNRI